MSGLVALLNDGLACYILDIKVFVIFGILVTRCEHAVLGQLIEVSMNVGN